ncbi:MAG: oligosaccharide flippase family protein [Dechloromonas sp.]|nr:oligosaccharide flippase family protein [Candidatus Dechloromonas phosphoritropha]MBP8788247.1 oligosaccharide flippase family protein [Azonexus sp.]
MRSSLFALGIMTTRRALVFSFLDRYASLLIAVASSMVIARLLTPAEIGVFSITMVLLMFVSAVRDMGAGQYLIQEKDLTTERLRAVWAVQLGLGLALACLVLLASYPVAIFYDEPRMRDIMLVVALNYAVNPFGSITYAWLMREMRFESIAIMRFSASLSGALVSIWLAWNDYGPISLAFGLLASTLVNALSAIYFRPKSFPWLPGVSEIRCVLSFGSQLTASSVIDTLIAGAPELLLGKLQSLSDVGLYSRSNGLVEMFNRLFSDAVAAVCLPWFAEKSREQGSLTDPFLKATAYLTGIGWPFCLAVICLAHPIVLVLYGNQWDQAVDLTRLLALAAFFSVPVILCRTMLLSSGAVTEIVRVTVFIALQTVVLAAIGASHGLMALGLSMIVVAVVRTILWLRATSAHLGVPMLGILRTFRLSAAVAVVSAIGPIVALIVFGPYPQSLVFPLLIGGFGGLAGFVFAVMFFHHPLRVEILSLWTKLKGVVNY